MLNIFDFLEDLVDDLLRKTLSDNATQKGKVGQGIKKKKLPLTTEQHLKQRWERIAQLRELGGPSQLRQAAIEADKLIDQVLKYLVPGETMGERLKAAQPYFADGEVYDQLWKAHKVRNALVHEPDFQPTHTVLKTTINNFAAALNELL